MLTTGKSTGKRIGTVITKIGQDAIDKIHADWASMETNWVGAKWQ
jgi:hypothetical protein